MSSEGKYFSLISKHCNLVIGCEHAHDNNLVVLCNLNENDSRQVWYEDIATGTIRTKANEHLCLTVNEGDNRIHVESYRPGDQSQCWKIDGELVRHRVDNNKVLDIADGRSDCGACLCSWNIHGGSNQSWNIKYLKPRLFFIVSALNGKVLDVANADVNPGAKLIVWDKGNSNNLNQLWYEDKNGCLRSGLNHFAPDCSHNNLTMQPFDENDQNRCWSIYGSTIFLKGKHDHVFDIFGGKTESGALVGVHQMHGGANQQWFQEFIE